MENVDMLSKAVVKSKDTIHSRDWNMPHGRSHHAPLLWRQKEYGPSYRIGGSDLEWSPARDSVGTRLS
jgi:hypothetical protein